jgi:hypothetical protein
MEPATPEIVFRLTRNNLSEGGRQRRQEAYLNVDRRKAAFFGGRDINVITNDGMAFPARLSGNSGPTGASTPKNLRSRPSSRFGEWLLGHCHALPGDEVHVNRLDDHTFLFQFVPQRSVGSMPLRKSLDEDGQVAPALLPSESIKKSRRRILLKEDAVAATLQRAQELAAKMQMEGATGYSHTSVATFFSYSVIAAVLGIEQIWAQLATAPTRAEIPESAWAALDAAWSRSKETR